MCKKKDQLKSNDPDLDESDLDNGDTDSVTTDSSFSTQSDGFEASWIDKWISLSITSVVIMEDSPIMLEGEIIWYLLRVRG